MYYFQEEKEFLKISQAAAVLNVSPVKLYKWIEDLERHGVMTFQSTALGSRKIEKGQMKIIEEYIQLRQIFKTPYQAAQVLKTMNIFENEKDYSWARKLKNATWRIS